MASEGCDEYTPAVPKMRPYMDDKGTDNSSFSKNKNVDDLTDDNDNGLFSIKP